MTNENIPLSGDSLENVEQLDIGMGELQSKVRDLSNKVSDENPEASAEEVSRIMQERVGEINDEIPNTSLAGTGVIVGKVTLEDEGTVSTELIFPKPEQVTTDAIKTLVPTKNILIVKLDDGTFGALDQSTRVIEAVGELDHDRLKEKLSEHYADKFALAFFDHTGELPVEFVPKPPGIITTLGDLDWSDVSEEDVMKANKIGNAEIKLNDTTSWGVFVEFVKQFQETGIEADAAKSLAAGLILKTWGIDITTDSRYLQSYLESKGEKTDGPQQN